MKSERVFDAEHGGPCVMLDALSGIHCHFTRPLAERSGR
jgi:hypothetical protein